MMSLHRKFARKLRMKIDPDSSNHYHFADWPLGGVKALATRRGAGHSEGPFDSFNLADHVGDNVGSVRKNREQLSNELGLVQPLTWLDQVHGNTVVAAREAQLALPEKLVADAIYANEAGIPCAVLTADCLPILLSNRECTEVAAIHAGWRSLARGIIAATVQQFYSTGSEIFAWLGPAIGPKAFEVGSDVQSAMVKVSPNAAAAFSTAEANDKFWCDIYRLAKIFLAEQGIEQVFGGRFCTVRDREDFYSYRRDGQTGRMASVIWIE